MTNEKLLDAIGKKSDAIDKQFQSIDKHFQSIDKRLDLLTAALTTWKNSRRSRGTVSMC